MKSIELTEDHKTKLLEMCKVLFSEYEEIDIEIEDNYEGIQNYIQLMKKCEITIYIHWFEFCMTHLCDKIYNKFGFDTGDFSDYIQNLISKKYYDDMHPIDYLYEEFKKLNHEK